ncbi:MAG: hypothetical protein Q8K93_27675 [Reyranella sp.]|uniref:hypothetical protein n=1 Tax=Reyranella sp. TaxID=1929291 RepID=UPI00272F8921|nr:hypothetical protein [Reyranella sp.]MDP1965972.1 hypothetical protein [Reyranella sp.]MDP2374346.1 hypothetical protein [Reyranella sp.]
MRDLHGVVRLAFILACFCATPSFAGTAGRFEGWQPEPGVDPPSYAVIDPQSTDLNIDSVVLACEEAGDRRVLQLQIYLSTEGPLGPKGVSRQRLKEDSRAEIAIDGRIFPVGILFADEYAVLADETERMVPQLSERLLDAMEKGRTMILRFDLVAELAGQPLAFDGEAVITLQAGGGGKAVSAVRRCAAAVGVAGAAHDGP